MTKLWTQIRHNPCAVAGCIVCLAILLWIYGCESSVSSLKQPHLLINRSELHVELDTILSEVELKISDLDKQDAFKRSLFTLGVELLEGGKFDPLSLALVLGNILGIGVLGDNLRKNTVIKVLKNNSKIMTKK